MFKPIIDERKLLCEEIASNAYSRMRKNNSNDNGPGAFRNGIRQNYDYPASFSTLKILELVVAEYLPSILELAQSNRDNHLSVYEFFQQPIFPPKSHTRLMNALKHYGMVDELLATPLWPLDDGTWTKIKALQNVGGIIVLPLIIMGALYDVAVTDDQKKAFREKPTYLTAPVEASRHFDSQQPPLNVLKI